MQALLQICGLCRSNKGERAHTSSTIIHGGALWERRSLDAKCDGTCVCECVRVGGEGAEGLPCSGFTPRMVVAEAAAGATVTISTDGIRFWMRHGDWRLACRAGDCQLPAATVVPRSLTNRSSSSSIECWRSLPGHREGMYGEHRCHADIQLLFASVRSASLLDVTSKPSLKARRPSRRP